MHKFSSFGKESCYWVLRFVIPKLSIKVLTKLVVGRLDVCVSYTHGKIMVDGAILDGNYQYQNVICKNQPKKHADIIGKLYLSAMLTIQNNHL